MDFCEFRDMARRLHAEQNPAAVSTVVSDGLRRHLLSLADPDAFARTVAELSAAVAELSAAVATEIEKA